MKPATTLSEAGGAFAPFELRPDRPESDYYVQARRTYRGRARDPLTRIRRELESNATKSADDRRYPKILVTGHKGAGKSTELQWLGQSLSERYEVITCSLTEVLNPDDLDARDVLLALAAQVVDRLRHYKGLERLERDPDALSALRWISRGLPRPKLEDGAVDFNLLGIVSGRLRMESGVRKELRRLAENQPEDLRALLNLPLQHLENLVERPPLLIVDNLDKYGPEVPGRDRVFSTDLPLLLSPRAVIVFTIPLDVRYDTRFSAIHQHEPHAQMIGHIKLWMDREQSERFLPGWEVMRAFVAARASLDLFAPEALELAILMSGGSFDQLRRLIQNGLFFAEIEDRKQVVEQDIREAMRELRGDFIRTSGAPRYVDDLNRIHEQKQLQSLDDLGYLRGLTVFEYENDDPWYDVNPVFLPYVLARAAERAKPA